MQQQCTAMQLDCANYIEVRVYESNGDQLGNILGSNCIPISSFSPRPTTLCDLQADKNSLLGSLPEGKTVVFRLRALTVLNSRSGCNDDLPGQPPPVSLFDGLSAPVPIDGASHEATIEITQCGRGCANLPPSGCPNGPGCQLMGCPPGTTPASFPNSGTCCPFYCKMCDSTTDPSCGMVPPNCDPQTGMGMNCPIMPGTVCPDGTFAVTPAGQCCPTCAPPGQPPMVMPDGGITPNH